MLLLCLMCNVRMGDFFPEQNQLMSEKLFEQNGGFGDLAARLIEHAAILENPHHVAHEFGQFSVMVAVQTVLNRLQV